MTDSTLLDIFRTQAQSALSLLQNPLSSRKNIIKDISNLCDAAKRTGNTTLSKAAEEVFQVLQTSSDSDPKERYWAAQKLFKILKNLDQPLDSNVHIHHVSQPPIASEQSSAMHEFHDDPTSDESPTRVRNNPRRRSSRFDTAEHRSLLLFFSEEAREALDHIASLLLSTGAKKPAAEILNELMRLTHGLKGSAGTVDLPSIASITHEYETVVESISQNKTPWTKTLREELLACADELRFTISEILEVKAPEPDVHALQVRLVDLHSAHSSPKSQVDIRTTTTEKTIPLKAAKHLESSMLRVEPERIETLMSTMGVLLFDGNRIERRVANFRTQIQNLSNNIAGLSKTVQSLTVLSKENKQPQIAQAPWQATIDKIRKELEHSQEQCLQNVSELKDVLAMLANDTALLQNTESKLQKSLVNVRMQSAKVFFQRLQPQIRTIARQANKSVELITAGGETEFDKLVADQLVDPMIQLLRNAVAHGIESPALRLARNKKTTGRVLVSARHEGEAVIIDLTDDGTGLDTSKLRAKAIETGLWTKKRATQAREQEIMELVFQPNFSTRTSIDELSGRGMGLNAVQQTITGLGGHITVSSQVNQGCTFTLRLPLTTIISNAMLFKLGTTHYALPSSHVASLGFTPLPLPVSWQSPDGLSIPFLNLHATLGHTSTSKELEVPFIVMHYLGNTIAFPCDRIIGVKEIVVKKLGPILSDNPMFTGATIGPTGKVQLILDPAALCSLIYPPTPPPPINTEKQVQPQILNTEELELSQTVLVVDDSKAIRETMRHMLELGGYKVEVAESGDDAWELLLSKDFSFVVTDLDMPLGDGFSLLERIKNSNRHSKIRTIVVSSKTSDSNQRRANELDVHAFLGKPVHQEDLVDAIRSSCKQN